MSVIQTSDITAVILAGGQGRRMGGRDKGLMKFSGRPMIALLIEQIRRQKVDIVINANRNHSIYAHYGYPVISDRLTGFQGPLAGFAAAMATVTTTYILTLPCDGPWLADSFVDLFIAGQYRHKAVICVADDGERLQPVYALIRVDLLDNLNAFLETGARKIEHWYAQFDYARIDFSHQKTMFANMNKPEDYATMIKPAQ